MVLYLPTFYASDDDNVSRVPLKNINAIISMMMINAFIASHRALPFTSSSPPPTSYAPGTFERRCPRKYARLPETKIENDDGKK